MKKKELVDLRIIERLENRMSSARIVGRGTVVVDSSQVVQSQSFRDAKIRAKRIVDASNNAMNKEKDLLHSD